MKKTPFRCPAIFEVACLCLFLMVSGCVSTDSGAARDSDIVVKIDPITMKENTVDNVSIVITDRNLTYPVYAVSVRDITGFDLIERNAIGGILPGDTVKVEIKVKSPEAGTINNTTIRVSCIVQQTENGNKLVIKDVAVPVTILPDARINSAGLTIDAANQPSPVLEVDRGSIVNIAYEIKNFGQMTIPGKTMWVKAQIENPSIGGNASEWVMESMAFEGTSGIKYMPIQVKDDAPNGKTDVILQLKIESRVIDEKRLTLKVKL